MSEELRPVFTPDSIKPGDRLYAFCFAGLTITGEHKSLTGFVTAPNSDMAKQLASEGIFASPLFDHPESPRLQRQLWVWELPLDVIEKVLKANG